MPTGLLQNLNVPLPRSLALPVGGTVNLHQVDKAAGLFVNTSADLIFNLALGTLVLLAGWYISRWLALTAHQAMQRARIEETFAAFLGSLVRYSLFLVTALLALNRMGLSATSLVAFFGALGLAIALAMRNTLNHFAAGIMLIVNQPFKVGDWIETPLQSGTVKRITLFNTELNNLANVRVFIPNSQLWETTISNHSYNAQRQVEVRLRAGHEFTSARVCSVLRDALTHEELVLPKPEPYVALDKLQESAVEYVVRAWVRTGDATVMSARLPENLRMALADAGIPWPTPKMQLVEALPAKSAAAKFSKTR